MTRGGAREGAGRKPGLEPMDRPFAARFRQSLFDWLRAHAERQGSSINALLNDLVAAAREAQEEKGEDVTDDVERDH